MIRKCLVCGKSIKIAVDRRGKCDGGHYFGTFEAPIEGTGVWKFVRKGMFMGKSFDVVDWTGKKKELECWECDSCFGEAAKETRRKKKKTG